MLSREELRDVVRGRRGGLERRVAIALLLHADDPEREAVLASVANDTSERPQQRSVAAISLGHVKTAEAERLLGQVVSSGAPPSVLADALRSLGRIGSPESVNSIVAHALSSGPAAAAARYALALIAYRFRLPAHDLPVPAAHELLDVVADKARPMEVGQASAADSRAVVESLDYEPYGIELTPGALTKVLCGTDEHVICVNRELAAPGAAASLLDRKALVALVALRSREGRGYSVSHLVLSTPSPAHDGLGLLAPRCSGRPMLAGSAQLSGDKLGFSLRSVDRPGARPFAVEGTLELGIVTISAGTIGAVRNPAPAPTVVDRG